MRKYVNVRLAPFLVLSSLGSRLGRFMWSLVTTLNTEKVKSYIAVTMICDEFILIKRGSGRATISHQ